MKTRTDKVRFTKVSRGWRAEIWGPFNMNRCTLKASGIGATKAEARRVARARYRARGPYILYRGIAKKYPRSIYARALRNPRLAGGRA